MTEGRGRKKGTRRRGKGGSVLYIVRQPRGVGRGFSSYITLVEWRTGH